MSDRAELALRDKEHLLNEIERLQAALNGRIEVATNLQMECERLRTALQEIHYAAAHNEILHPPSVAACARRALEGK